LTDVEPGSGVFQLNATIQNNGSAPATTGTVPISWEDRLFEIALSGGVGSLNESVAGLDLNGDGDKIDSFEVTWFHNETRPLDAIVDGVHAYSLYEGYPEGSFWLNRTYYIDGKPKLFKLGTKTHVLYEATAKWAFFGLDAFILHHPSPNFQLYLQFYDLDVAQNLNAIDVKIDGESVEINHTITLVENRSNIGLPPYDYKLLIIPNKATQIDLGENVSFSFILRANKSITADVQVIINWSPDGIRRILYPFEIVLSYPFVVNTTSTTSATSATTNDTPGFSILTTFPVLIMIVFLIQRRRYN
jgi:hypothetical protein